MTDERLVKLFGWNDNPFTFRIVPNLFVGYEREMKNIMDGLNNGDKFSLLTGPTGSGKTTLLKTLQHRFPDYRHVFYLPKPPKDPEDWVKVFDQFVKPGLLKSLLSRGSGINIYNLSDNVNRKLGKNRFLLFVDECHEASIDSLEWLRTLADNVDNLSVLLAGLPVFDSIMKNSLETFSRRINTRTELGNLNRAETRELVKKRIEGSGGSDIRPFTSRTIDYIYETTGGFPREVIRVCNDLARKAAGSNISTIDSNFIRESEAPAPRVSMDAVESLPDRQKLILDSMKDGGEFTPSEIVSCMSGDIYKNRDNAIRSVNNLLRRLMKEGFVERKRVGKTYKYVISGKFRTLMVDA